MKIAVTYSSIYGASAYYAELLAGKLGIAAQSLNGLSKIDADVLFHFGGLYAGTINGLKKAASILPEDRFFVLCTVGLADPGKERTRDEIMKLSGKILQERKYKVFLLRGDMDYSKLTFRHSAMMWALVKMLKARKNRSDEDEALIRTYGGKLDFKNPDAILPIVRFAESFAE